MFLQTNGQAGRSDELEFFRRIAEESRDIILVFAMDGKLHFANRAAVTAYGYSLPELCALEIQDLRDPSTIDTLDRQLEMIKQAGALFRTVHKRRGGELFPVEINSKILLTAAGEFYLSVIRDITAIRQAEEVLRSANEFGHGIVEGLDIPFFAVDRQYRYFVFNQAHVRAMKTFYGADIRVGESILSYYSDADALEQVQHNLDEALAGRPCVVEALVGDAEWQQKFLRVEHNPVKDAQNQIVGVVVFCSDISEQKKAEQEASACDLRYRELVEATQVIIMALGPNGKIGYLNEYGLNFFGYESAAIQDQPVWELLLPELAADGRDLRALYLTLQSNTAEGFRKTHENRTADCKRVWVDWTVRRGANPQSGEAGWLCVGIDVTARHRLLEEERKGYERRRCNELMQDIIAGRLNDRQLQQSAAQLRLNLTGPFVCLLVALAECGAAAHDAVTRRQAADDWIDSLKQQTGGIVWQANEAICLLLPCDSGIAPLTVKSVKAQVAGVVKNFEKYGLGKLAVVGASYPTDPSAGIPLLYEQAAAALAFGPFQQPNESVHFWHELGWIRLLAKDIDSPAAQQYIADSLGPLLRMTSQEKRRVMMATLRELLAGRMYDEICERLQVHPQTVRYRKRVIEKLLNVDLGAKETVTNLAVAMKLYDVQQVRLQTTQY